MATFTINMKDGSLQKDRDIIIGIDLGTTNSLVAYIKDGEAVCVPDEQGKNVLVPSIVHFADNAAVIVGDAAREYLISDPGNTIYSVKRLMGKSYKDVADIKGFFGYKIIDEDTDSLVKIKVGERFFTPIELSAHILRTLKVRIEQILGSEVSRAVITVPAYFNDNQRQATRDAGKLAGLDVLRIVNEPTAAALAYGIGLDPSERETIAVYDLGGGTFDISILQIHDGIFEVLATSGDTFLGGDDFDKAIIHNWLDQLGMNEVQLHSNKSLSQEIRLQAEMAKKALSSTDNFTGMVAGEAVSMTRSHFETLIAPLVERSLNNCRQALQDAQLGVDKIDKVVMVGGSTRVPAVQKAVAALFEKPVFNSVDPDQAATCCWWMSLRFRWESKP